MNIKERLTKEQRRKLYGVLNILPDKLVIYLQHYAALGRMLNLKNPKRFTDKIQWYKLNYRDPLMTKCADKYQVRNYLEEKGLHNITPTLYQVCNSFEEIKFEELPNSFVIKSNNGTGTNIFIEDKKALDFEEVKDIIKSWNQVNTITVGREWAYKDIEPKIIIEEILKPKDEFQLKYGLNDYKFMCFNGKPELVWVDIDRHGFHSRKFYTKDWSELEVLSDRESFNGKLHKPFGYEKMIEISTQIAADFPFVRVDFYSLNNRIYIGELTFYPWSGTVKFNPDEFDYRLGELFNLPKPINMNKY